MLDVVEAHATALNQTVMLLSKHIARGDKKYST